jgi:hypothetical protein
MTTYIDSPTIITEPGYYALSANFLIPNNGYGIKIRSSNVTLDFAGFGIDGQNHSGNIVEVANGTHGVIIKNGFVKRSGHSGIIARDNSQVKSMTVFHCRKYGISIGNYSLVEDCEIYAKEENPVPLQAGIITQGDNGIVRRNKVIGGGNAYFGIRLTGKKNLMSQNRIYGNIGYSMHSGNLVGNILSSDSSWRVNQDPDANWNFDED